MIEKPVRNPKRSYRCDDMASNADPAAEVDFEYGDNRRAPNPWDERHPTLGLWWEIPESDSDKLPVTVGTSEKAKQEAQKWIAKRLAQSNLKRMPQCFDFGKCYENTPAEKEACRQKVPLSVIKSGANSLIVAVRRMYDLRASGPKASDKKLFRAVLKLVRDLKCLTRDLGATCGCCCHLAVLIERYDSCRSKYTELSKCLPDFVDDQSKYIVSGDLFRDCMRFHGCEM